MGGTEKNNRHCRMAPARDPVERGLPRCFRGGAYRPVSRAAGQAPLYAAGAVAGAAGCPHSSIASPYEKNR